MPYLCIVLAASCPLGVASTIDKRSSLGAASYPLGAVPPTKYAKARRGSVRQGSCEHYTLGWGLGAAKPPPDPTLGSDTYPYKPPNCKAARCQAKPCLTAEGMHKAPPRVLLQKVLKSFGDWCAPIEALM